MRRTHRLFAAFLGSCGAFALIIACGGGNKPPPGDLNADGSLGNRDGTAPTGEGGGGGNDASSDVVYPDTCRDTIRNGFETDTDCGGNECPRCIDQKDCIANTDCAGGFCDNKKCVTATCNDKKINGDEADVDCGGKTCAKCNFGKKCAADTDCVSSKCDSSLKQCACPPRMVVAATNAALGGAYCIDETETTAGDYDRFVKSNQSIAQQIPTCATINTSYVPSDQWPPVQPLSVGYPTPVRFVDWCDAFAYCKWAGKQLCGAIGGGTNAQATSTDHTKSAWFNACTAQGANVYPYGSGFDPAKCWGSDVNPDGGTFSQPFPVCTYSDDGSFQSIPLDQVGQRFRTCQGGSTGLYGMSGNVAEWEDSCTGTGAADTCLARGGSFVTGATPCASQENSPRLSRRADLGFRCCQF